MEINKILKMDDKLLTSNNTQKLFDINSNSCISEHLIEMKYNKGEIIYKEGEVSPGVFLIKEGVIDICSTLPGRKKHLILVSKSKGDFFGAISSINCIPSSSEAYVKKKCICYMLPTNILHALLLTHPSEMMELIDPMAQAVAKMCRDIIKKIYLDHLILPNLKNKQKTITNSKLEIKNIRLSDHILDNLQLMPLFDKFNLSQIKLITRKFKIIKAPKRFIFDNLNIKPGEV